MKTLSLSIAALCSFVTVANAGITIQFDYSLDTNNFFSGPNSDRRAYLESAGGFFESILNDNLTGITPGGPNTWTASFFHPGNGTNATANNLIIPENTIIVYAGGQALGGNTLGQGGPGGYSAGGFGSFLDNLENRGQGVTTGAGATDFSLWGGSITFDTQTDWYFDDDVSDFSYDGGSEQIDFYSVAIHELGHVLGVGGADSWLNQIITDDDELYFTGANSVAANAGNVLLANAGHLDTSLTSNVYGQNIAQEPAMSPSIGDGERKYFTDLDVTILEDIGWTVIPEPSTYALLAGLIVSCLWVRRRK